MEAAELIAIKNKVTLENRIGGDLKHLPCPFCSKPRSQRSTYIRCQRCGVNWFKGDPLDRNPHANQHRVEVISE